MNKILIFLSLVIIHGCLISPKELDELNADNDFYSPAQTIKCMQMQPPQRPTPINKKGEIRESYDQSDCYDDLLTKNSRELIIEFKKSSIKLDKKEESIELSESTSDIDIEAIEEKVLKKNKKN
ncbi:MAG: hypothetical protein CMD30_01485 [Flavobacteriales bacterium]|nr:hypothetical protein [Flavobacteriales bacterium]|tara:strand:- start:345 stop:716 length:372 start_codon:yes stop_codon:yes gene_type:complete